MDVVSHAYGWTDNQILDLTLPRLRMAVEAITKRRIAEREFQIQLAENVTVTIASGFAVMVTKKQASSFESWIRGINFLKRPQKEQPKKGAESRPGSGDRLMRMFNARR